MMPNSQAALTGLSPASRAATRPSPRLKSPTHFHEEPEKKMPTVVMTAGADDITQRLRNKYMFRASFANSDSSHPLGEWAYKQGYRKAVLLSMDFGAGYEQVGGFARTFIESGGKIIQEIYTPLDAADYLPYLALIKQDADVVMGFYAGAGALRL